jgi:hypothetical protein
LNKDAHYESSESENEDGRRIQENPEDESDEGMQNEEIDSPKKQQKFKNMPGFLS